MNPTSYCLFETPLGPCGIAWTSPPNGSASYAVKFFQLPEATVARTESRIAKSSGSAEASRPPAPIADMMERVRKHLAGDPQDFRDVPVDLTDASPFVWKVCIAALQIPAGKTVTYAQLAMAIGQPRATRAVGRALGQNPIPLIIPCHRVLAAHGKPGGFSAHGGRATKAKMLALEGVSVNLCLDLT